MPPGNMECSSRPLTAKNHKQVALELNLGKMHLTLWGEWGGGHQVEGAESGVETGLRTTRGVERHYSLF